MITDSCFINRRFQPLNLCIFSPLCFQVAMNYKLSITTLQGGVDRLVNCWPVLPAEKTLK